MNQAHPLVLVCVDGLDEYYLRDSVVYQQHFQSAFPTSRLIHVPEYTIGPPIWASLLTGWYPHQHGQLSSTATGGSGAAELPLPPSSLLHRSQASGRTSLAINFPESWFTAEHDSASIGERFFQHGDAQSIAGLDVRQVLALRVAATDITGDHLRQLSEGLLELPTDDTNRKLAAALLAQALSVQNLATAALGLPLDFVAVRFDALAQFFAAFIDHAEPAPYLSPASIRRLRPVLQAAVDLHLHFLLRLRQIAPQTQLVVCSDHGWHRKRRHAHDEPLPERFSADNQQGDIEFALHCTPHVSEYHAHQSFLLASHPAVLAPLPEVTTLPALHECLAARLDDQPVAPPEPVPSAPPVAPDERLIDDLLELGLYKLPDVADAQRDLELLQRDRRIAASHQAAGEWIAACQAWQPVLGRNFILADAIRHLQCVLRVPDWRQGLHLATNYATYAPFSVPVVHALALCCHRLGAEAEAREHLGHLAAIDSDGATATAVASSLGYSTDDLPAWTLPAEPGDEQLCCSLDLEWWRDVERQFSEPIARFASAEAQLRSLDLVPLARHVAHRLALESTPQPDRGAFEDRLRSRGLSSVRRHADPSQAAGLDAARGGGIPLEFDGTVMDEASALHRLLFAAHPNVAAHVRQREDKVQISSQWLDGVPAKFCLLSTGNIQQRLDELDHGFRTLTPHLAPPLLAGAIVMDFTKVHPFVDGNGRTSRMLAERMLARGGCQTLDLLNLERRLDRQRAFYEAAIGTARRRNAPEQFLGFWAVFLAVAAEDALARAERCLQQV